MPWNDNANPGPWGSPPSGGNRPGGGSNDDDPQRGRREEPRRRLPPPGGPGLGELWRRLTEGLRRFFFTPGERGVRAGALGAVAAGVFGLWVLSGIFTVDANQVAVITRFGMYDRSVGPGLHYHLPMPVERAELVSVTRQNKTDIGGVAAADAPEESLMLTGDENIVDLDFTVQWHISSAPNYLFSIRDPNDTVGAVAESAMREVVGRTALEPILTNGRSRVQAETKALMQRILNSYRAGVIIDAVQIRNANPPSEVVPFRRDIAKAGQDADSYKNEALTYRNRVVNEAKGDAARIVQNAEGYREQVVREAEGQASRFNQLYAQYRLAPDVTRQRLYIETMEDVLARSNKVVIDAKGSTAPIILPPDAFRPRNPPPAAAAPAPEQPKAAQP